LHIADLLKISLLVTCTAVVCLPLHQLGLLAQLATMCLLRKLNWKLSFNRPVHASEGP